MGKNGIARTRSRGSSCGSIGRTTFTRNRAPTILRGRSSREAVNYARERSSRLAFRTRWERGNQRFDFSSSSAASLDTPIDVNGPRFLDDSKLRELFVNQVETSDCSSMCNLLRYVHVVSEPSGYNMAQLFDNFRTAQPRL